ncbi:MAG: TatD family deoxyribonuclease [Ruminococcaceae bacterium]|nr:TatD family deoxyribonuclease [Oscillospiraceae bacterium]
MEKIFDSHAHYYDARFSREMGDVDELLSSLFSGEIGYIVNVGTDPQNSLSVVNEAKKWKGMYAAVGIHPSDGQYLADRDAALADIEKLLCKGMGEKVVALGEIGLDYHYEDTDRAVQGYLLEQQLCMAERLGVPVIIHDRDAHGDCFDAVCRHPSVRGVFHSYSGSAEMARDLVRRGWHISFSGVVTFKNASRVREAVAAVPMDRLLIETDCPYLAPHPHRGKLNHSGYLTYTAAAIAEVKGVMREEVLRASRENAKALFGIAE